MRASTARIRRVAVAGGGVTGLAAAHRFHELAISHDLPLEVSVLEASGRVGGVVSSRRVGGYLLEEGPDSMITDKPWGRALAERIGLGDRLVGTLDQHRRTFVVRKGRMQPTPEGFYLLAPSMILPLALSRIFSPLGKARMAMDLVLPRRRAAEDESVGSFVTRRLGREALDRMAQPMVAGIYGADPHKLSLQATFPRFQKMEEEHGSVIRAMWAARGKRAGKGTPRPGASRASGARYGLFVSFDEGLQVLVDALAAGLPAGTVRTDSPVEAISPAASGGWELSTASGAERFDAVVLALGAPVSSTLVQAFDPELGDRLASISYASAITVSLAFKEDDISHPMEGFGFVAPTKENLSMLGCTFCHRKYPGRSPEGRALLRAFCGEEMARLSDDVITERVLGELRTLLGIHGEPALAHVARWPCSMPQYAVGHLDLVSDIEARTLRHPGLALAGNAYRGIGIPDCVHSGENAAASITVQLFPGKTV